MIDRQRFSPRGDIFPTVGEGHLAVAMTISFHPSNIWVTRSCSRCRYLAGSAKFPFLWRCFLSPHPLHLTPHPRRSTADAKICVLFARIQIYQRFCIVQIDHHHRPLSLCLSASVSLCHTVQIIPRASSTSPRIHMYTCGPPNFPNPAVITANPHVPETRGCPAPLPTCRRVEPRHLPRLPTVARAMGREQG